MPMFVPKMLRGKDGERELGAKAYNASRSMYNIISYMAFMRFL